jgi:hypothetical protein
VEELLVSKNWNYKDDSVGGLLFVK